MNFCKKIATVPLPITEKQLCRFVAYLREEGLRYQTVKIYLAAVRHMEILHDIGDPEIGAGSEKDEKRTGRPADKDKATYHTRNIESHTSALERDDRQSGTL